MKVDILECRTQFVLLYAGFSRGTVKIDTITSPITEGFQPEGDFTVDVKWKFCCRTDGKPKNPLHLPNREPIILFQKALSKCQEVYGKYSNKFLVVFIW